MPDQFSRRSEGRSEEEFRVVERGFVTTTPDIESGERPFVMVKPRGSSPETQVFIPQSKARDRSLPGEGREVYFARTDDDNAVLIGVSARDHDGYSKERRIDHTHTDSHVQFNEDGDVFVEAEGDVYINGVHFLNHDHDYDWEDDAGSGTTEGVNE